MRTARVLVVLAATGALFTMATAPASADRLSGSPAGGAPFSATMVGAQEISPVTGEPGAGDPLATGHVVATINPGLGVACYELQHDLTPLPFGFHIHDGDAGVNGPIVIPFFQNPPSGVVPPSGCVAVDRDLATEILANPEGFYFNLHNAPFPGGAVRGQLSASSR
jgi:hypothetical protein